MKHFKKWLLETDQSQPPGMGLQDDKSMPPPPNGGITPQVPPEIADELSSIAQKLNDLLKKLGIGEQDNMPQREKGLADKPVEPGKSVATMPQNFQ